MKNGKSDKQLKNTSKFISLVLRHQPEVIGTTLDEHGWQRYSFNEDHTLIRANQGHSIPVDVELEEKTPPEILWHGTGEKYVSSINAHGLIPKSRLYVHLSSDMETARKVGSRHGKPIIYEINCRGMAEDGYRFFLSANHVWLTKEVPVRYLKKL